MTRKQFRQRTKMSTYLKVVNYRHIMPTRYTLKLDLGKQQINQKKIAPREGRRMKLRNLVRKQFEKAYTRDGNPKVRWFFRKLYF